jgi:WD40 repeat protein
LELPEKLYVYKFAWKPDFTLLLINGKDGLLLILTTDLVALTTLYPTEKCLNKIVWHPDAFTNNVEISPRCKWFAATTSKGLLVYDCSSIEENKNFADNIVANFEGHLKPPLSLAWCPFEGNKIVSTAADGLALVIK